MIQVTALLIAAASVGVLHISAPDHWVTLIILGKTSNWSHAKLLRVSMVAVLGHVGLSVFLGFLIVALGLVFSKFLSYYFTEAVGAIMLLGGLCIGARALLSRRRFSNGEPQSATMTSDGRDTAKEQNRKIGYFAVLGAALSPDLSILPIFLIAVPVGIHIAVYTAVVFALASILTMILLISAGSLGLSRTVRLLPPHYNDAIAGFVIAAVGLYVLIVG